MSPQLDLQQMANLPTLKPFVRQMAAHLTSNDPAAALFVHAPTSSQLVTPMIKHLADAVQPHIPNETTPLVEQLLPKLAVVNLEEIHSTRQAFDRILNQLSGWTDGTGEGAWDEHQAKVLNWDGRTEGVTVVKVSTEKRSRSVDDVEQEGARKRARLNDAGDHATDERDIPGDDDENVEKEDASAWRLSWDRALPPRRDFEPLRDTLEHFYYSLSRIFALGRDADGDPATGLRTERLDNESATRWIVIDHAEMLSDLATSGTAGAPKETGLGMTLLGSLLRLRELSRLPISVIFVSTLSFTKARDGLVGVTEPVLLDFPDLNAAKKDGSEQNDTLAILTGRFAARPPPARTLRPQQVVHLFSSLASVVWSVFSKWATDIDTIAYLAAKFWPKWLECVENSNPPIAYTNTAALHQHLKPDFARERDLMAGSRVALSVPLQAPTTGTDQAAPAPALHGFVGSMPSLPARPNYLAAPGSPSASVAADVFGSSPNATSQAGGDPLTPLRKQVIALPKDSSVPQTSPGRAQQLAVALRTDQTLAKSLPAIARYLLLASYYASFNPPKSDVRCFVRVDEGIARKGKKGRRMAAPKPGSPSKAKLSSDLAGGKAFPLERLLAIFESIVDEKEEYAAQSSDVLMQVATLINLRLLHRVSAADKLLDNVKLKCKVNKDTVDVLAKSLGKNDWRQMLYDPDL